MQTLSKRVAVPSVQAAVRHGLRVGQNLRLGVPRVASTLHFTTDYNLTTEDRLEIMDLCHKFDVTINQGQQEKLAAYFVPDAQITTPVGTIKGVGPITDFFIACRPTSAGNRHLTCNVVVQPDGVRAARATAYRLLHTCCSPPTLLASGVIEDRLVNVDGEWRFAHRAFLMDPPAAAVAAGAASAANNAAGGAAGQQQQQAQQPPRGHNGNGSS